MFVYMCIRVFGELAQPICPLYHNPASSARQPRKPNAALAPRIPPALPHVPAALAIIPAIRALAPRPPHEVVVGTMHCFTAAIRMCILQ